jgi:DNA-binding XRE family transcriptional regulator
MKTTKLKQELIERGIKQNWLAQRTGINESILSLIISGKYNPDERQKNNIAAAIEMDVDDLF